MCGRYFIEQNGNSIEMKRIIETLTRKVGADKIRSIQTSGDIYPGNIVPALAGNKIVPMQWGFVQHDGSKLINARSETAGIKNMYKRSYYEMRCLIPASGYYEWRNANDAKTRFAFQTQDDTMYMAAIYRWEYEGKYPRFVILTQDAKPEIRHIHDRMPLILRGSNRKEWLLGENPSSILRNLSNDEIRFNISLC